MFSADSDEGFGVYSGLHGQEGAGEHFFLARDEMDVGIIDVALAIEDFVDTIFYISSQFTGFPKIS